MKPLAPLGWDETLERSWNGMALDQAVPGRVIADYGSAYKVAVPEDITAELSGRLQYFSSPHEMPKVGDWVAVQLIDEGRGIVHAVLPRASEIGRKQPGEQFEKQVLATNVDVAFLVQALDHDFSPQRMQRYLFQLSKDGVEPILVLNKADKDTDTESKLSELKQFDARIIVTSAILDYGIDEIAEAIAPGNTAVFLGSSGVGKSTIVNALLGRAIQATHAIREADSKGRHTTTHRELFILPNGGLVIDTPGLRELQLWGTEDDLGGVFADIETLAKACKFNNCTHANEPDCAIAQAIASGALDGARLDSYLKFQRELRYLGAKVDEAAALERKQRVRKVQKYRNQIVRDLKQRKGI